MEYFQKFLQEYSTIVELLKFVFFAVLSLLLFAKTKNIKYLMEVYDKMSKYRTEHTLENSERQTFSEEIPVYKLNKSTGVLEETKERINQQELINSNLETALTKALERLMPVTAIDNEVKELNSMQDDLDSLILLSNKAEEYKTKLNLDKSLSISQVFDIVKVKANDLQVKLVEESQKQKEIVKEVVKEVTTNEKENV